MTPRASSRNAIGGENVTTTIEGRERYPVTSLHCRTSGVRSAISGGLLVPASRRPAAGAAGAALRRSPRDRTIDGAQRRWAADRLCVRHLADARSAATSRTRSRVLADEIQLPPKAAIAWSGQYEEMLRVKDDCSRRSADAVPDRHALYLNTRSMVRDVDHPPCGAVLGHRRVLVPLSAWLQHERPVCGSDSLRSRGGRGDRRVHAALSRSRLRAGRRKGG